MASGMPADITLDPAHTAVLSMDLQAGVVSVYVKDDGLLARAADVIASGRRAGAAIVHVKVGLRPNVPEASPRNAFLSAVKASIPHQRFFQNESGAIHPAVAPAESDVIVTKSRVSAFAGTDLDLLLRAQDRHTLVVFGVATSGVVLSTVLQAADLDYRVLVVSDCCADNDHELHDALVQKALPRQATVVSADEIARAFRAA
jgi:nicotinamidase-related amidase